MNHWCRSWRVISLVFGAFAFYGCSEDAAETGGEVQKPQCDCQTGGYCTAEDMAECRSRCPETCANGCNSDGSCKSDCPETCANGCNEDGSCKTDCPETCANGCNSDGSCKSDCPETCANGCNSDGSCKAACPETCANGCNEDGSCRCAEDCRTSCDAAGHCQCAEACADACGADGACACPETCASSCDVNGVCQCPETCPDGCTENGECLTMCGDERVEWMAFSYKELDLLAPGSTGRTSYSMTLNIRTDKKTYTLEDFPCKDDVILETLDPSVATVARNAANPKTPTFTAVAPGATDCIVSLRDKPGVTGTLKLHVLNLDVLHADMTKKTSDGKYARLLKSPLTLRGYSQGFDFYDEGTQFFSRLDARAPKYTYIKDGKTGDVKYLLSHVNVMVFKNDGTKNSGEMTFFNAGHGQNLNVEPAGEQDYLWFANFNSLYCSKKDDKNQSCSGSVYHSQTISRVPWQEGVSYYPGDVPENYGYLKDGEYHYFLEPALDVKNNKFGFKSKMCPLKDYLDDPREYGKCTSNAKETIRIYNLSDVKTIEAKLVTIPRPLMTLDNNNSLSNGDVSAWVKNLAAKKPIHEFTKREFPIQGTEIENGILYTIARVPYLLETPEGGEKQYTYRSIIPIFVYDYNGKTLGGKTAVKDQTINKNGEDEYAYFLGPAKKDKVFVDVTQNASCGKKNCHGENNRYCECEGYFLDNEKLDAMFRYTEVDKDVEYEMCPNGFYEPEGIRVSDGKLYVHLMLNYVRKKGGVKSGTVSRQVTVVYDLMSNE